MRCAVSPTTTAAFACRQTSSPSVSNGICLSCPPRMMTGGFGSACRPAIVRVGLEAMESLMNVMPLSSRMRSMRCGTPEKVCAVAAKAAI